MWWFFQTMEFRFIYSRLLINEAHHDSMRTCHDSSASRVSRLRKSSGCDDSYGFLYCQSKGMVDCIGVLCNIGNVDSRLVRGVPLFDLGGPTKVKFLLPEKIREDVDQIPSS